VSDVPPDELQRDLRGCKGNAVAQPALVCVILPPNVPLGLAFTVGVIAGLARYVLVFSTPTVLSQGSLGVPCCALSLDDVVGMREFLDRWLSAQAIQSASRPAVFQLADPPPSFGDFVPSRVRSRNDQPMEKWPSGLASATLDWNALSPCVRDIAAFLDSHFAEPLTWRSVAVAVCRHEAYIARAFRRQTGMTMRDYLRTLRLFRAVELIRAGEKIDAAMLNVGYRSKRTFYGDFRASLGVTPGKYRALAQRTAAIAVERP